MPEYFELTLFLDKVKAHKEQATDKILDLLSLHEGRQMVSKNKYSLFIGKEVLFDIFEYDDTDYTECRICLSELFFTKMNFKQRINQILEIANVCFNQINAILFITGIYELTYDLIKEIKKFKDFNKKNLSKFPILFFKKENDYDLIPNYSYGSSICVVNINKNTQDIYVNPIKEF